jgi:hypothetical protein
MPNLYLHVEEKQWVSELKFPSPLLTQWAETKLATHIANKTASAGASPEVLSELLAVVQAQPDSDLKKAVIHKIKLAQQHVAKSPRSAKKAKPAPAPVAAPVPKPATKPLPTVKPLPAAKPAVTSPTPVKSAAQDAAPKKGGLLNRLKPKAGPK